MEVVVPTALEILQTKTAVAGDVLSVRQSLDGRMELLVNGDLIARLLDATNLRATAYGIAGSGDGAVFDDFAVIGR
jgi:hypothetical protein